MEVLHGAPSSWACGNKFLALVVVVLYVALVFGVVLFVGVILVVLIVVVVVIVVMLVIVVVLVFVVVLVLVVVLVALGAGRDRAGRGGSGGGRMTTLRVCLL